MGCNCGGGAARGSGSNETLGYYVVLPDGSLMPAGVNPDDPEAGEPPYMIYAEALSEALHSGGGSVHRLRKKPVKA